MKSLRARAILCCLLAAPLFVTPALIHTASAQSTAAMRVIQGKVYADSGSALAGAVVYLKNMKSLEIKTYISTQDGSYRFGQLGNAEDYQLWAEQNGHKSKVKNISSFDSKKLFDVALHLE